jgi:metal-dependent amidase/aminoacylase/carboxypeptidase family protein
MRAEADHNHFAHCGTSPTPPCGYHLALQAWHRLQTLSSREINPLDAIVASVTMLKAGETHNVIPDTTWLGGTLRALRLTTFEYCIERLQSIAAAIAHAHRCNVTVSWDGHPIYPPTVNAPQAWDFARGVATEFAADPSPLPCSCCSTGLLLGYIERPEGMAVAVVHPNCSECC